MNLFFKVEFKIIKCNYTQSSCRLILESHRKKEEAFALMREILKNPRSEKPKKCSLEVGVSE